MIKNMIRTGLLVAILTISQLSAMDYFGETTEEIKVIVEPQRNARAKFNIDRGPIAIDMTKYPDPLTAKNILDEFADIMGDPEVSDQLTLWEYDIRGNLDRVRDNTVIDSTRIKSKKPFAIDYDES